MSTDLIREMLIHHLGMPDAIDATGGWPVGYSHVQFYHAVKDDGRYCRFTNCGTNTGYWTTVATSDQYHWSRISAAHKRLLSRETVRQAADILRHMELPHA